MSFRAYKNKKDGSIHYAFQGEECRLPDVNKNSPWDSMYVMLPPNPSVIIGTVTWMAGVYLDSMKTMYELDRILNIEAEQNREDKAYQEMIKNI